MSLQFRPKPTGNASMDENLRQAFDYIYSLRAQLETLQESVTALQEAITALQR